MKYLLLTFALLAPFASKAADGWTNPLKISIVDTVFAENNVYITLENYTNAVCSGDRISLQSTSKDKFDLMFSLVLSAFHSGAKIKFYLPNTASCISTRVQLVK